MCSKQSAVWTSSHIITTHTWADEHAFVALFIKKQELRSLELSGRSFMVSWKMQQIVMGCLKATFLDHFHFSLVLAVHGITKVCHSEKWLFLSLLRWWHSTLPLILTLWFDYNCSYLIVCDKHFLLDEGPSRCTIKTQGPSNPTFHHNFSILEHC